MQYQPQDATPPIPSKENPYFKQFSRLLESTTEDILPMVLVTLENVLNENKQLEKEYGYSQDGKMRMEGLQLSIHLIKEKIK